MRSTDTVTPKIVTENYIDWFKTLKNQIIFNKNKRESKENSRPRKESKTNWEDITYAQLTIDILKKTLNNHMEVRHCAWCNMDGHTVYIYKKNI